jgi:hypothetical protein
VWDVQNWLEEHKQHRDFFDRDAGQEMDQETWKVRVHGAKVLAALFDELTESRIAYRKVEYGPRLTRAVLNVRAEEFDEIRTLLGAM